MTEQSTTTSPADTIRTALQGAMVGAWGRENALRALADLESENERLAQEVERRAAENARLQDGAIQMVNALWLIYEQAQSVARKPSPA